MSNIRPYLIFTIFLVSLALSDTARKYGIGFGYSSNPDAVDAIMVNPAGVSDDYYHRFYAGYSKLYIGIADDLYRTYLMYSAPKIWGLGLGAGFSQFGSDAYSNIDANIAINYKLDFNSVTDFTLGVSPHIYRVAYSNYDPADPLFAEYGDSKMSIGLDAGIRFRIYDFSIGGNASNIIKPNMALDDTVESGKLDRNYEFGLSYTINSIGLTPFLGMRYEEDDPESKFHPSFGLEAIFFDGLLALRANVSDNNFNTSVGFSPFIGKNPVEFDYCYSNPTGDLGDANLVHHHFGLGYRIRKREKPVIYPDLSLVEPKNFDRLYSIEKPISMNIDFIKDKVNIEDSVDVVLNVIGTDHKTLKARISFAEKDTVTIPFQFGVGALGEYRLLIVIDPDSLISEKDEGNNAFSTNIVVSGDLIAEIKPEHNSLKIEKLTFFSEEEPFVPIIFFDESSARIPTRFHNTLDVLAKRLKMNPDIGLELHGYVDNKTDSALSLATQRSVNVKRYLVSKGVPGVSIKIIPVTEYDIEMARIVPRSKDLSQKEITWIHDENRRVELKPVLKGERELVESWEPSAYTDGISGFMRTNSDLICNNPDITIQFEWTTPGDIVGKYDDISNFRNLIQTMIEGECGRRYNIPIIVKRGAEGNISLSLSSEKIIYAPIQHAQVATNFDIPDEMKTNSINIDISDPEVVIDHDLYILDVNTGDTLKSLSKGKGAPPDNIDWDWRDDHGVLLDPTGRYTVGMRVHDVLNKEFQYVSDTMEIIPTESMERNTSSIIIQFVFDEIASTSHFLESRIDHFAQWIIKIAESEEIESANIRVIGHTDPIGKPDRNRELSNMRAEKEYKALFEHLSAMLELTSIEDVENWLIEKGINLTSEGVSAEKPYTITRPQSKGNYEKVLLGDNKYPEGRSINRRVVIEVEEKFKGGVEAPAATVPLK